MHRDLNVIARNAVTKQSSATRRAASGLLRGDAARNDVSVIVTPETPSVARATSCVAAERPSVTPAKAGVQHHLGAPNRPWIPAFAGMTDGYVMLMEG